ncbi:MAG: DUF4349 domain-containing protein [Oscillospiraceae bacterium]|jgi:hypothetical protein|nr:DUF4349 domain-containing protein [Oscillospiraceae bacterium]
MKKKQRGIQALSLAALLISLFLTACSSGIHYATDSAPGSLARGDSLPMDMAAPEAPPPYPSAEDGAAVAGGGVGEAAPDIFSIASQNASLDPARKLIREAALVVETTDFAGGVAELEHLCTAAGGYVESSTIPGLSLTAGTRPLRSAHYLFRIPVGEYAYFVQTAGQVGNLLSRTENTEDITDRYFDTEAHLKVLMLRRDRLLVLLAEATDSEAIVNFEQSLSETQYEIEQLTGTLQKYDALVSYTVVDVTLQEVVAYTDLPEITAEPKTTGERIVRKFSDSASNIGNFFVSLFVFLVGNSPYLLLLLVLLALLTLFIRKLRARPKKPKPAPVYYSGHPIGAAPPANRPGAPPAAPGGVPPTQAPPPPAAVSPAAPASAAPEAAGTPPEPGEKQT